MALRLGILQRLVARKSARVKVWCGQISIGILLTELRISCPFHWLSVPGTKFVALISAKTEILAAGSICIVNSFPFRLLSHWYQSPYFRSWQCWSLFDLIEKHLNFLLMSDEGVGRITAVSDSTPWTNRQHNKTNKSGEVTLANEIVPGNDYF